ncbi:MAG: tRNA-(ms[2]io[6]A)-hydroxylase [Saprospiraceae bacterium]|nr:tRNA-(ms[2]io[6]A)-hydroxylase [Saprospiraceae bacterium]
MKLNLDIRSPSKPEWLNLVLEQFDDFLKDHADCERKASAMAMSLVAKYPDRILIHEDLIDTAIEELEHFKMVYQLMRDRGIEMPHKITEDPYIKKLVACLHSGRNERFLDHLLVGSVFETRGAERFKLIEGGLTDPEYKKFYKMLWTSEAKHGHIYIKMALHYFPEEKVYSRLNFWLDLEAEVIDGLELRPALH